MNDKLEMLIQIFYLKIESKNLLFEESVKGFLKVDLSSYHVG